MLELQLPHPMPHAVPREPFFDIYSSARPLKLEAAPQMQLPVPQVPTSHGYDNLRTAPRPPLTPPSDVLGSAVRVVSLPPSGGVVHEYGYQLPAIGNSRTAVTARANPEPQQQPPQQVQQQQSVQDNTQRRRCTISPNLRIPSSIKTPQEGLPQLAAEVRLAIHVWPVPGLIFPRLLASFGSRVPLRSSKCLKAPPNSLNMHWSTTPSLQPDSESG
jgi:hypothetical protein